MFSFLPGFVLLQVSVICSFSMCVSFINTLHSIHNFLMCHVSIHGHCHNLPCLNEFSSVVLICFTLSRQHQLNRSVTLLDRKTHSDHCPQQLFIQGHGSGKVWIQLNLYCLTWNEQNFQKIVFLVSKWNFFHLLLFLMIKANIQTLLSHHISPDAILCGWQGSKHQLTNYHIREKELKTTRQWHSCQFKKKKKKKKSKC